MRLTGVEELSFFRLRLSFSAMFGLLDLVGTTLSLSLAAVRATRASMIGQIETMHPTDNRIAGHTAKLFGDMACQLARRPEFFKHVNALVVPRHCDPFHFRAFCRITQERLAYRE